MVRQASRALKKSNRKWIDGRYGFCENLGMIRGNSRSPVLQIIVSVGVS